MRKLTISTLALALAAGTFFMAQGQAQAQKRFIAIGTGGPTGVYFATGNAICRLVHKTAASFRF